MNEILGFKLSKTLIDFWKNGIEKTGASMSLKILLTVCSMRCDILFQCKFNRSEDHGHWDPTSFMLLAVRLGFVDEAIGPSQNIRTHCCRLSAFSHVQISLWIRARSKTTDTTPRHRSRLETCEICHRHHKHVAKILPKLHFCWFAKICQGHVKLSDAPTLTGWYHCL